MNSNTLAAYLITMIFNLGMFASLSFYNVPLLIIGTLILINSITMMTTFQMLINRMHPMRTSI